MRLFFPLMALIAFATATHAVLPRAADSYGLLEAQDDPVALADIAVAKKLSPSVAAKEIEDALAAGDADMAASFLELARDRGMAVDPALAARVEAANATGAQVVRAAMSFGHGLVTGAPDDLAGFAGTAAGDLFVFGDVRDAVREGIHMARGETADELVLGLAGAGIALTAGTYATLGAGAPARIGLSLVKAARKTGRLAAPVAEWMTRAVREAVDTKAFGAALSKVSITAPTVALRAARDAVKVERAEGIVNMVRDVGRVQSKAGTRAALEGLKLSESPKDVSRARSPRRDQGRQDPGDPKTRRACRLCPDDGGDRSYKLDVHGTVYGIRLLCRDQADHRADDGAVLAVAQADSRAPAGAGAAIASVTPP